MVEKELESALSELMKSILDAKDFALAEAPEVIHQLITYEIASAYAALLFYSALIFLSYKVAFKWAKQEDDGWGMPEQKMISIVVGSLVSMLSIYGVALNIAVLMKLHLAPKVFLLEYAAKLV
jgi:hypothetical protein